MTRGKKLLVLYLLLLAASHLCKPFRSETGPLAPEQKRADVAQLQIAYRDLPATNPDAPTLVLLHGSPHRPVDLPQLRDHFRLLIPDLPGFGASTSKIDDYSLKNQATHVLELLDHLKISNAHILGHGLGGGVALNLYSQAPGRVSSLTLVSANGVQELELLGDYTLNHAVYGAQLFYSWLLYEGTPNFGLFDHSRYNLSYAHSYYDSDHRPLRDILLTVDVPTLIIHGQQDLIVPIAAAKEHARLVPHSETHFLPNARHQLLGRHSDYIATAVTNFITTNQKKRGDSTPKRAKASAEPFDYHSYQSDLQGRILFIVILLAIATLVSEDITCITAGLLVSQGAVGFFPATLGCFLGIFIGDTGLYLIGRILGVRALKIPPLKWFVNTHKIERSKKFFDRYGPMLIVVTRWLPGMRIPTYVAAGMLKLPFFKFITYFLCAAVIWTPALVGISTIIGERLLGWLHKFEQHALLVLVLTIATVLFLVHLALALATHRGRQLLKAKWHRRLHWQFWPTWITHLPLLPHLIIYTIRYRRLPTLTLPEGDQAPLSITADGKRTLEYLILDDLQTRPHAKQITEKNIAILEEVPEKGTIIQFPETPRRDRSQSYLKYLRSLKLQRLSGNSPREAKS